MIIARPLSLLNPFGWFGGYRAKLSGGQPPSESDVHRGVDGMGPVTLDRALQLATFWACVRLTAQTVGTLPINLYAKGKGTGFNAVADDHPLYALIHDRPNLDQTPAEFWEGITAWMLTWGTAYAEKFVTGGQVRALTLLRSDRMVPFLTSAGETRYRYTKPTGVREYGADELFIVRAFGFGATTGMSVIQYGQQTWSTAGAADLSATSTFQNGMRPSGWFKYKGGNGVMTPTQRDQAKKVLVDPYTGAGNTARVGILEGDFDWIPATMPPDDTQLLETRRFSVEEICRWFGVPPVLIGHSAQGQTMFGAGVESIMLGWLTLGLRSILRRIQQCVARDLLAPADRGKFFAEFNQDALLQADTKTRTEIMARRVQNGLSNRNEERALDNLPPYEGGETFTVQSNLLPVDKLGIVAVQPTEKPLGEDPEGGAPHDPHSEGKQQ